MIFVVIGTVPLLVWAFYSRSIWPEFVLAIYLLTSVFVLLALIEYPGPGQRWFWKSLLILILLHCALLIFFTVGAFAIIFTGIKPPTAILFGFVGIAMGIEARSSTWLMKKFLLKYGSAEAARARHYSRYPM